MLLKLLCLIMLCGGARANTTDELMDALGGVGGESRMVLCMAPAPRGAQRRAGAGCRGALWRRHWVLARPSCLEGRSLSPVRVAMDKGEKTCDDYREGNNLAEFGSKIRVQFTHPEYRADLALLALDLDYHISEKLVNTSTVPHQLSEFEPWMEEVYKEFPMGNRLSLSYKHDLACFSTPLRMFITTVLLPLGTFMLFFMYVIHYTGPKEQIPYHSIDYDSGHTEEEHKHADHEKCEETEQPEANDTLEQYDYIADIIFNSYGV